MTDAETPHNAQEAPEQSKGAKVDAEALDEAYSAYQEATNMSASELERWSETECSKLASDSRAPIERNLRLLRKPKSDWTSDDIEDANRTVSFVARMRGNEQGEPAREGCPSKRDISLRNWAYDPSKGATMQHDEKDQEAPQEDAQAFKRPEFDQKQAREHKPFVLDLKEVSDTGEFMGYASVFGNRDLQGDVMERGAFSKTLEASGGLVPILDQHDATKEIGLTTAMEEDAHGLKIRGQLYIDNQDSRNEVPEARSAYVRMRRRQRAGLPQQMSIGYRTIKRRWKDGVRYLQEVALGEVSTVTFAANPMAQVATVKAHGGDAVSALDRAINTAESHLLSLRQLRDVIGAPPAPASEPMGGEDDGMSEPDEQDAMASEAVDRLIQSLEQVARDLREDGEL